jgi:hypothetical protein
VHQQFSSALAGTIQKPYTAVDLTGKIAAILEKKKAGIARAGSV